MRRVPTSVTVLSILGLIFSFIGIIGLIMAVAAMGLLGRLGPPNPMMDKVVNDQIYLIVTGLSLAVGVPLMVLLVAGSIGSLQLKPWARGAMLIYAWGTI